MKKKNERQSFAVPLLKGKVESCDLGEFIATKEQETASYWVHIQAGAGHGKTLLCDQLGLDSVTAGAMLSKKVRPRILVKKDSLLLILRVADTVDVMEHEELRSLRIYVDRRRLVSVSLYSLPVVHAILKALVVDSPSIGSSAEFFVELLTQSVRGLEDLLQRMDEEADRYERQVLEPGEDPDEREVASLSLDALHLRRCLYPQKDAMFQLQQAQLPWWGADERLRASELHERIARQLDEIEGVRERVRVVREQLSNHLAEQLNHRVYVFSVIAVIFVPLGFLTGLFGVNVGGIPGADSPFAFLLFCSILGILTLAMLGLLKRYRWL